jgi:hypothetical protein
MIDFQSISQIYAQQQSCSRLAGMHFMPFRVRDVTTLRDYLVLDFPQVGFAMEPRWAEVMGCDDQIPCTMDCTEKKYASLSSFQELTHFARHKKSAIMGEILHAYRMSKF